MRGFVIAPGVTFALAAAAMAIAQTPPAAPQFEVASIKPAPSPVEQARAAGGGRVSFPMFGVGVQPGGRLVANATLHSLILRAYDIREYQLEGEPDWATTDYFNITAKAGNEAATVAELNEMLKSLLADRFGLRVHVETRQATVHMLTLARADGRLGPGLKRTSPECEAALAERKRTGASPAPPPRPFGAQPRIEPICGMTSGMGNARTATETYAMGGRPIADLVGLISSQLEAPVVDRTGLNGLFDVVLEFESAGRAPGAPPPGPDPNNGDALPVPLPAAVKQQLGLKLEKTTGPLPITIIDAANPPSPN